jgi:hypothetical protein
MKLIKKIGLITIGIAMIGVFILYKTDIIGAAPAKLTVGELLALGAFSTTTKNLTDQISLVALPTISYVHVFTSATGTEIKVTTNKSDYEQLASKNPQNPTRTNAAWKYSYSFYDLPVDSYANENDKQWLVNVDGRYFFVPLDKIAK